MPRFTVHRYTVAGPKGRSFVGYTFDPGPHTTPDGDVRAPDGATLFRPLGYSYKLKAPKVTGNPFESFVLSARDARAEACAGQMGLSWEPAGVSAAGPQPEPEPGQGVAGG